MNYDPFSEKPDSSVSAAESPVPPKQSKLHNLLLFFSIILLMLAGYGTVFLSVSETVFWFLPSLLALPLPIICVVLGAKRKKADPRYRGTMIGGIVILTLLVLSLPFGLSMHFASMAGNNTTTVQSTAMLENVENLVNIDFPAAKPKRVSMTVYDQTAEPEYESLSRLLRETYVPYTDADAVDSLAKQIAKDDRWLEIVPNSLYGLFCPNGYRAYRTADCESFVLLYNMDTGEYNRTPTATGTYRFLMIRAEFEKNVGIFSKDRAAYLYIYEYELNYIG